jgi:hypothetical protein
MATVPLSTLEFTVAQGSTRVAAAHAAEGDYDPRRDFYKALRERTARQLREGWNAAAFKRSRGQVKHPRTQPSYEACRRGLTTWARGKDLSARRARPGFWQAAGLEVRVNPELRLVVDGERFLVKLYFKADEMSAARAENTLFLLETMAPRGVRGAVLDLRRGDLLVAAEPDPGLDALLASEAAAFASLLDRAG